MLLRQGQALHGGFPESVGRFGVVIALEADQAEQILSKRITLVRGFQQPGVGRVQVPRDSIARVVKSPEQPVGQAIILAGSFLIPVCRLLRVPRDDRSGVIKISQRNLSLGIPQVQLSGENSRLHSGSLRLRPTPRRLFMPF